MKLDQLRDVKLLTLRDTDAELIDEVRGRIEENIAHRLTRSADEKGISAAEACHFVMKDKKGWPIELSLADLTSLLILECLERMSAGELTLLPFKRSATSDGDQHGC